MSSMTITYSVMLDQFQKICSYYFFDSEFENRMMKIFAKIEDLNADEYARKHEQETDAFIHQMAQHVDGERKESLKLVREASDEIIATLVVRLVTFEEYCRNNPNKTHFMFGDTDGQLVIECLINFWRVYDRKGPTILGV